MSSFQKSKIEHENKIVLHMMSEMEKNPQISQRNLASSLGVAMGLVNTYIKRCINKGWVKVNEIPAKRFAYYLTPQGFAEKSKLTAEYLSSSLDFFRIAKEQCLNIFEQCKQNNWNNVALLGEGDLCDIAILVSQQHDIKVKVLNRFSEIKNNKCDAVIVTDVNNPQDVYDSIVKAFPEEKVFAPQLLHVTKNRRAA